LVLVDVPSSLICAAHPTLALNCPLRSVERLYTCDAPRTLASSARCDSVLIQGELDAGAKLAYLPRMLSSPSIEVVRPAHRPAIARNPGRSAAVICPTAPYAPPKISEPRRQTSKRRGSRLRSFLRDVKDVLLMAVGRDDDDDYECANG
jgi:hypothetical protein